MKKKEKQKSNRKETRGGTRKNAGAKPKEHRKSKQ